MQHIVQLGINIDDDAIRRPDEVFTYQPASGWLNGYDFAVGVELQSMSTHNKTYAEDFKQKFPKALTCWNNGYPAGFCRNNLYQCDCSKYLNCAACWNEVMED